MYLKMQLLNRPLHLSHTNFQWRQIRFNSKISVVKYNTRATPVSRVTSLVPSTLFRQLLDAGVNLFLVGCIIIRP